MLLAPPQPLKIAKDVIIAHGTSYFLYTTCYLVRDYKIHKVLLFQGGLLVVGTNSLRKTYLLRMCRCNTHRLFYLLLVLSLRPRT